MGYEDYTPRQRGGSEFGGVQSTPATIQPMPPEALTAADQLRLGYLSGVDTDPDAIEDRRQMMGLRPADGRRPSWLKNTGQISEAEVEGLGEQ